MTGIDRYISELLFDHDCVILPGVGGFLTNYSGARIHPIRHSFQPASRTVVFNANLRTNDGLLIDHVSRTQEISYQQASVLVNEYAAQCLRELEAGNTVTFNNIGRCRMGKEKNIIFDPDESSNYLADAFGLPSFVSPAIKRETVRQRLEKQLTPRPSAPKEEKKRDLSPVLGWAAGIAIPIAAAVLLYLYAPSIINGLDNSYASFVPTVKFKTAEPAKKPGEFNKDAEFVNFRVIPEKVTKVPAEPVPDKINEALPEAIKIDPIKKYQIVVGAFSKEANAEKYVNELRGREYNAGIIGESA
ncbi:MAG: SPOR domain-containing protein, partial [Bacteroidales bacterium]|nr:SPOR domain-containing protein [Bacteroidales bacterium]